MNDLQKELQELKVKVAELESRIVKTKKWQPKGGDWYISGNGKTFCYTTRNQGCSEFGTERATQAQAERATVEMRMFNRLLALRDELCGNKEVDWTNDEEKYYVYFSHESGAWYVSSDEFCKSIQPYFTSENVAQKACDMLNSGEVEL